MDLRSLACFIAVAEDLHFRRAAARLNLTQSALSQRIRALEEDIGTPLLERDRRHVSVTPAGAAFLVHARTVVASAKQAKTEALRASRGEIGRLRLGFTVIAFYGALPLAVRRFRNRYPAITIELSEMNSPRRSRTSGAADGRRMATGHAVSYRRAVRRARHGRRWRGPLRGHWPGPSR